MGIRISEMEEATTFGADDYVPIVTNGTNKKALGAKIKDFIAGFFATKNGDNITDDSAFRQNIGLAIGTPTITPASGVTIANNSTYKIGNIVGGSLNMEVTASVGTYANIGNISPAPNSSIRVPITRAANGSHAGLILIFAQTGQMQILANQALSGNGVSFTFSYTS